MHIQLDGVNYKSGRAFLCRNISWEFSQGEHWVLFGENGSGKTTLLSLIAGYHSISGGTMTYDGEPYSEALLPIIKKEVALVSSSFFNNYYHNETLLEIVLSAGEVGLGVPEDLKSENVRRAKHLLAALGLKNKYSHPFRMLSKGQQQSVLIARAMMCRPKLLLLDEIYAGLDVVMREYVAKSLRVLCEEENVSTIMVTHDTADITADYTHVLLLKGGKVFTSGTLKETMTSELLTRYFRTDVIAQWEGDQFVLVPTVERTLLSDFYHN